MAKVRVLCFASLTDHLGSAPIELDLAAGATVAILRQQLASQAPAAAASIASCRVAVNRTFAQSEELQLKPGDEVAMIPPVSGG